LTYKVKPKYGLLWDHLLIVRSSDSNPDVLNGPNTNIGPTSSEGGPVGVFNPNATRDVYACEAPYYLELRGSYSGAVTYTGDNDDVCTWEASLQVRGNYESEDNTRECLVTASYGYRLTEGSDICADGMVDGTLQDPLLKTPNLINLEKPEWPFQLPMQLNSSIADGTILPLSTIDGDTRTMVWQFGGIGNTSVVDNDTTDGLVTGSLFKR